MKLAGQNTPSLPSRIVNYTKARPGTGGDVADPLPYGAAMSGGIQGFVGGGIVGVAGGAVGGYVGVRAGAATNSFPVALAAGAATGAVATTALGLGMLAVLHPQLVTLGSGTLIAAGLAAASGAVINACRPVDREAIKQSLTEERAKTVAQDANTNAVLHAARPVTEEDVQSAVTSERIKRGAVGLALGAGAVAVGSGLLDVALANGPSTLIGPALVGGFIGAVGTLSGDRRGGVRDGVYGGMILGGMAGLVTGNPLMMVAGAAGAGMAGRAVTPAGKVTLGVLTGAAMGAIAGTGGGVPGMISGAIAGSLVAPVGSLVGPVVRQVLRNATADATTAINSKLDPYLKEHPLNHPQKLVLGATMGAIALGSIGRVGGWEAAGIAAGVGAVTGAVHTEKILRQRAKDTARKEQIDGAVALAFGQPLDMKTLVPNL